LLNDFSYAGVDQYGEGKQGHNRRRGSQGRADIRLKERGLTVIELKEKKGGQITFSRRRRINNQDTYYMARELSHPAAFGMQIDKAVEILMQSAEKQEMKEILSFILTNIRSGKSVTLAFQETGRFSQFLVNMIHNNEEIGRLPDAFDQHRPVSAFSDSVSGGNQGRHGLSGFSDCHQLWQPSLSSFSSLCPGFWEFSAPRRKICRRRRSFCLPSASG
jgi:type II secretory pathway component PulF